MEEIKLLTPKEFDQHLAQGTLRLSFIGMSNGGKSFRSRILHDEAGFFWYCIDTEIQNALGFEDINKISAWMGYPMDEGYGEREQRYLKLEDQFTKNASVYVANNNLVFDTTGSVVHLVPETQSLLRENCLVVHLDVGEDSLQEMTERFFREPKPVAWGSTFLHQVKDRQEALRSSYPVLLGERLKKYRALAHLNIPAKTLRDKTGADTLAIIRAHL